MAVDTKLVELIQQRHDEFEDRYSPGPDWEPFNQTHRDRGYLLAALRALEKENSALRYLRYDPRDAQL